MNEVTLVATNRKVDHRNIQFFCCYDQGQHLIYLKANDLTHPSLVGQIHVVKLQNHVRNVGCFLVMESGEKLFLPEKEMEKAICVKRTSPNKTFCQGDLFLLQIKKDALKTKDAVATAVLEITDDALCLGYPGKGISISRKATAEQKEGLLSALSGEAMARDHHILIRTEGAKKDAVEVRSHLLTLGQILDQIRKKAEVAAHPVCLYEGKSRALTFLDAFPLKEKGLTVKKILTDDEKLHQQLMESDCRSVLSEVYRDETFSLGDLYRLQTSLKELTGKTVWMKNGGNLVIEPTEALTVIDVNSARASSKKDLFAVNMEAAKAAMEQLRLRNISGIVLVDFINLKNKKEEQAVLELLRREAKEDTVKVNILGYTATGLVEITREKIHPSLNQVLTGKIYCGNI